MKKTEAGRDPNSEDQSVACSRLHSRPGPDYGPGLAPWNFGLFELSLMSRNEGKQTDFDGKIFILYFGNHLYFNYLRKK